MFKTDADTSHAWPLLFTHRGIILGNGFLADIELHGRILARAEADGVWIDGVNPAAIALGAATLNDTHAELRSTLARVFIDFAEQTRTFEEFKARAEAFFHETDDESARAWTAAVEAVRAGLMLVPDGIQRRDAASPLFITVTPKPLEAVTPKDNQIVQQESQGGYYSAYARAA